MTLTPIEEEFVRRLRKFCITYRPDIKHIADSLGYIEPLREVKP
jgi:hypothetical protein